MPPPILGIHHVTAIATEPRRNLTFYSRVLGLRLVKRTVNFDDPGTHHLYYGDELGRPGTIVTFFPWPLAARGRRGVGQVAVTSFRVPPGALGAWRERLGGGGAVVTGLGARPGGEEVLSFLDPDGLALELITDPAAAEQPAWEGGPVAAAEAIRGIASVTLWEQDSEATAELLTRTLGFRLLAGEGDHLGFALGDGGPGTRLDVLRVAAAPYGRVAAGSVHHVAFRVADAAAQAAWRERLVVAGLEVTPVLDRRYFQSIYFREPGGVLFEIATDPPGFTRDEPPDRLGSDLKLPPWLESHRARIAAALPPLTPEGR